MYVEHVLEPNEAAASATPMNRLCKSPRINYRVARENGAVSISCLQGYGGGGEGWRGSGMDVTRMFR